MLASLVKEDVFPTSITKDASPIFQDQMEFPEAHVRFFPNGTSDEFTVILSSATAEQEVTLDVITGLADVKVIR